MDIESTYREHGYRHIAGIDEAGRGPWAGPVVAAACFFRSHVPFAGLDDSKKLSPARRYELYEVLTSHDSVCYGIGVVDERVIDEINILKATLRAMELAVAHLPEPPNFLLVDGLHLPACGDIPGKAVVRGDETVPVIAAASILAKEYRDRLMQKYHERYPEYGFDKHKGYGTAQHVQALLKHGPSPIHRRSFAPVQKAAALF